MKQNMHINSLSAFREDGRAINRREHDIILFHLAHPGKYTDRELSEKMGFHHKSAVQPRVSDLIKDGILAECGKSIDPVTGKHVRAVTLSAPAKSALPTAWSGPAPINSPLRSTKPKEPTESAAGGQTTLF